MLQDWVAGLKEKTGRSLDEWLKLIDRNGPGTAEARRDWLRKEHGLGTNSAWSGTPKHISRHAIGVPVADRLLRTTGRAFSVVVSDRWLARTFGHARAPRGPRRRL